MLRSELGERAVDYIRTEHYTESIGAQYQESIEQFYSNGRGTVALVEALAYLGTSSNPANVDLANAAKSIARNRLAPEFPRLLIDITEMEDLRSLSCVKELLVLTFPLVG